MTNEKQHRPVRVAQLFAIALVVVMAAATASAQDFHSNTRGETSGDVFNTCVPENVAYQGTFHFNEKSRMQNNGEVHVNSLFNVTAKGLGAVTLREYSVGDSSHLNAKFTKGPIIFRRRLKAVSNGSTDNFYWIEVFHVKHGEPTKMSNETDCRG